jgi:tetratricopeptide (TPR) repeat protein
MIKHVLVAACLLVAGEVEAAHRRAAPALNYEAANDAYLGGDYARAVTLYTAIISSGRVPSSRLGGLYFNRGLSLASLNRIDEAGSDLRQAIQLDPKDKDARELLASLSAGLPARPTGAKSIWGPLMRLPGKIWLISTAAPVAYYRVEWARIGVSMVFAGKARDGRGIEGQIFLDPKTQTIRETVLTGGKALTADVAVADTEFTEAGRDRSGS